MDVLTGGGLGDLFRKIILKERQYVVKNNLLILLGFRRLLYNPYAPNHERVVSTDLRVKKADLRKNYWINFWLLPIRALNLVIFNNGI